MKLVASGGEALDGRLVHLSAAAKGGDWLDAAGTGNRGAVVSHSNIACLGGIGRVGLGGGYFKFSAVVPWRPEPVDNVADFHARRMGTGVVNGDAFETGALQCVPNAFGIVGAAVKAADGHVFVVGV